TRFSRDWSSDVCSSDLTASKFDITVMFPGVEMHIVSNSPDGNGILFEGTKGRFHVSRGAMKGRPVEELKDNPLPEGAIAEIYGEIGRASCRERGWIEVV